MHDGWVFSLERVFFSLKCGVLFERLTPKENNQVLGYPLFEIVIVRSSRCLCFAIPEINAILFISILLVDGTDALLCDHLKPEASKSLVASWISKKKTERSCTTSFIWMNPDRERGRRSLPFSAQSTYYNEQNGCMLRPKIAKMPC